MRTTLIFLASIAIIFAISFYKLYNKNDYIELDSPIVSDGALLKDVTILTSSYDGYSELWKPHYELLFKNWPSLKEKNNFIPVMLITNNLIYDDPRVMSLKIGEDSTWSNNLLKSLESVKTKYVFLLFDDYIINSTINESRFIELLTLLEKTNGAYVEAIIDNGQFLYGHEKHKDFVPGIKDVIYRSRDSECRNSLQASIWNTKELKKLIDINESAWDFEVKGSKRTNNNQKPFYLVMDNPVISYLNAVAKRVYEKSAVDYINSQGIEFNPIKLPVKTKEEMELYLKSKEATDILSNYETTKVKK